MKLRANRVLAILIVTWVIGISGARAAIHFPIEIQPAGDGHYRIERAYPALSFAREQITFVTNAGDGSNRLFVVEKAGRIQVFDQDNPAKKAVFANLTTVVKQRGEETGLLGLAFSPKLEARRKLFVSYTNRDRTLVVARMRVSASDPDRADLSTLETVIEVPKRDLGDEFSNHNGGMLAFGPDGMLYIGTGDGGKYHDPYGNSQNKNQLLGKILRIDPSRSEGGKPYAIPADNPFKGANGAKPEIWAYGIRNPWRFSFDRANGELWLSDVGQDRTEEIDIVVRGGNYGWNVKEGKEKNPDGAPIDKSESYIDPIYEYDHSIGKSITGGYVYRGKSLPSLVGAYLFADYRTQNVWALRRAGGDTQVTSIQKEFAAVTTFGEDEHGEILLGDYMTGTLHRIVEVGNPPPPTRFPRLLSETRVFERLSDLKPAQGVLPYQVNSPLWSDGADKGRWIALPSGTAGGPPSPKMKYAREGAWEFPVGTILIKHFELEPRDGKRTRLETRLLVHHRIGSQTAWRGYTYRWNPEQTDAVLIEEKNEPETLDLGSQVWTFPTRGQCRECHNAGSGFVLGVRAAQIAQAAQKAWVDTGILDRAESDAPQYAPLGDAGATREKRARSYLASNCAHCHSPSGGAPGGVDLRFETQLADTHLVGWKASEGDLGLGDHASLRVKAGDKSASVLWLRMKRLDRYRMPKLASSVEDASATALIGEWIDSL